MRFDSMQRRRKCECATSWCYPCRFRAQRTNLSFQCHQARPDRPQVRQREQCLQLRRVLEQSAVAHLGVAELPFDHAERVLDLRTDAGLELLDLVKDGADGRRLAPAFSLWRSLGRTAICQVTLGLASGRLWAPR